MKCITCNTDLTESSSGLFYAGQRCCPTCYDEHVLRTKRPARSTDATTAAAPHLHAPTSDHTPTVSSVPDATIQPEARKNPENKEAGNEDLCVGLGLTFMGIGAYFLLVQPSAGSVGGIDIANLYRLTLGATSAIVGAIFLAAAIRPRSIGRNPTESPPDRHTTVTAEPKRLDY